MGRKDKPSCRRDEKCHCRRFLGGSFAPDVLDWIYRTFSNKMTLSNRLWHHSWELSKRGDFFGSSDLGCFAALVAVAFLTFLRTSQWVIARRLPGLILHRFGGHLIFCWAAVTFIRNETFHRDCRFFAGCLALVVGVNGELITIHYSNKRIITRAWSSDVNNFIYKKTVFTFSPRCSDAPCICFLPV